MEKLPRIVSDIYNVLIYIDIQYLYQLILFFPFDFLTSMREY